jgi:hypothetical protein
MVLLMHVIAVSLLLLHMQRVVKRQRHGLGVRVMEMMSSKLRIRGDSSRGGVREVIISDTSAIAILWKLQRREWRGER